MCIVSQIVVSMAMNQHIESKQERMPTVHEPPDKEIVKSPDKLMDSPCPNYNSIMSASEGGNFYLATSILNHYICGTNIISNECMPCREGDESRLLSHWPLQLIVEFINKPCNSNIPPKLWMPCCKGDMKYQQQTRRRGDLGQLIVVCDTTSCIHGTMTKMQVVAKAREFIAELQYSRAHQLFASRHQSLLLKHIQRHSAKRGSLTLTR